MNYILGFHYSSNLIEAPPQQSIFCVVKGVQLCDHALENNSRRVSASAKVSRTRASDRRLTLESLYNPYTVPIIPVVSHNIPELDEARFRSLGVSNLGFRHAEE